MAGPAGLANQARYIAQIFAAAEIEITSAMATRIAGGLTRADWASLKLAQSQAMQAEISRILTRASLQHSNSLAALLTEAYSSGAVTAGLEGQFVRMNVNAVAALVSEAQSTQRVASARILRSSMDAYREVIRESGSRVVTGTQTRKLAAQQAMDRFAARGIKVFIDKRGRAWGMYEYSEMSTRTASMRAYRTGARDAGRARGVKFYRVTETGAPCRFCSPWDGLILSENGEDNRPSIDDATGSGLFHPNCGHSIDPISREQLSRGEQRQPSPTGPDMSETESFKATQRQRRIERNVRRAKREKAAALDPAARSRAQQKVTRQQRRAAAHSKSTGQARRYDREGGRSGNR